MPIGEVCLVSIAIFAVTPPDKRSMAQPQAERMIGAFA